MPHVVSVQTNKSIHNTVSLQAGFCLTAKLQLLDNSKFV